MTHIVKHNKNANERGKRHIMEDVRCTSTQKNIAGTQKNIARTQKKIKRFKTRHKKKKWNTKIAYFTGRNIKEWKRSRIEIIIYKQTYDNIKYI